jgi:PAS domain S-box-containing protein
MDPLSEQLRVRLGSANFGLYAVLDDSSAPALLCSSDVWPPSGDDPASTLSRNPSWRALPPNAMRPIPRSGPLRLGLMPIGSASSIHAILGVYARRGAPVWRLDADRWADLAGLILLRLQIRDMDAELTSSAQFQSFIHEHLPIGLFVLDRKGRVALINAAAERILKFPAAEAVGSDCVRILRPAGVEQNPLVLGLRGKAKRVELYITDREGTEKPVWMQMSTIPSNHSFCSGGLIAWIRDTTEDRALEEDQKLRSRLASIGELSAGVAHEIRNPLTGIANCAQVLRDRIPPDDPHQRMISIILDETRRLNRIVENLLNFARPGVPSLKESNITEVVRGVLALEEDRMQQASIAHELKAKGNLPPVFLDPDQIAQVISTSCATR